jgi:peptide/nickel transport system substrate-binding protein
MQKKFSGVFGLTLSVLLLISVNWLLIARSADAGDQAVINRGGTLVAGKTTNWTSLIPTKGGSRGDDHYIGNQIFDTLIRMNSSGEFTPSLAESWELNDNALIMKLRRDVVFHDNTPFNAEAVKFVFDWYKTDECDPIFKNEIAEIHSVDVIDEFTIRFNLSNLSAVLLPALANNAGMLMSPEAIKKYGADITLHPVGTGPFMVKEIVERDHVTLTRNPNYYLIGEDGKPLPYLDEIIVRVISDESVRIANLRTGDTLLTDGITTATTVKILETFKNLNVFLTGSADHYCIYSNNNNSILKDVRVRKAIYYAINRQELCNLLTLGYGVVEPFPIASSQWFYSDYDPYNFDVERARQLMLEAGYSNGLTLNMDYVAREPDATIVQALEPYLKAIGITVKNVAYERNAWLALYTNGGTEGQLGFGRWTAPRVDAYVQIMNNLGENMAGNSASYRNPRFSELMEQVKVTIDQNKRRELIADAQKMVLDDAGNIWLFQMPRRMAKNEKLQGLAIDHEGIWILREAYITQ